MLRQLFILGAVVAATPAIAAPIAVTSYSMPNGSGVANTGNFNYWDLNYTGAGTTNVANSPLSGGVGDLTDGVIASDFWFNTENNAGTGPYVGWVAATTLNPTVVFNFAGTPAINSIDIHLDNSHRGSVFAPSAIWINGVNTPFTAPAIGTIGLGSFTGLNFGGNSLSLLFDQINPTTAWVFVNEVSFGGVVPEPASWAMLITGFGLTGAMMRRRRLVAA